MIHAKYIPTTSGSAPDMLAYDLSRARAAVARAIDAVRVVAPHGRDYVARDDDHLADLDSHRAMLRRLEAIESELSEAEERISATIE